MSYTVAIRERGKKSASWSYIAEDLSVQSTAENCKPLTREDAEDAARRLRAGAAKLGRPVIARVVQLPA